MGPGRILIPPPVRLIGVIYGGDYEGYRYQLFGLWVPYPTFKDTYEEFAVTRGDLRRLITLGRDVTLTLVTSLNCAVATGLL